MATRLASAASHRPVAVPQGYQTIAPTRSLLVPVIVFWALLLPAGLAIDLQGIVLPPYRIVLLLLAPVAVFELMRRHIRLTLPDYLFMLGSFWVILAYFVNTGIDKAIEGGGSFMIDSLAGYLIGRAFITDVRRLRTFLVQALPGVIIVAIILAVESLSHRLLIADLFPVRARYEKLYEIRLGLLRARASFPHSIAAGIFMTSLLPLYFLSGLRSRERWAGTIASLGAIFSVSSAAFLTILLTVFLIAYRWVFTRLLAMRERMIYIAYAFVGVFATLEILTGRGAIRTLISNFTLDPSTGYYRILIWEYGTASVQQNPIFGIGDAPMARARWMVMETIDNHWLMLAVKHGLPCTVLMLAGVIIALWRCGARNHWLNEFDRATTAGAIFALAASAIAGWTVAFWANNIAWFMLIAGVVVALSEQLPPHLRQPRRLPAHTLAHVPQRSR